MRTTPCLQQGKPLGSRQDRNPSPSWMQIVASGSRNLKIAPSFSPHSLYPGVDTANASSIWDLLRPGTVSKKHAKDLRRSSRCWMSDEWHHCVWGEPRRTRRKAWSCPNQAPMGQSHAKLGKMWILKRYHQIPGTTGWQRRDSRWPKQSVCSEAHNWANWYTRAPNQSGKYIPRLAELTHPLRELLSKKNDGSGVLLNGTLSTSLRRNWAPPQPSQSMIPHLRLLCQLTHLRMAWVQWWPRNTMMETGNQWSSYLTHCPWKAIRPDWKRDPHHYMGLCKSSCLLMTLCVGAIPVFCSSRK